MFSRIPSYLMADRRDRGEFLRTFFRRYEGATVEGIERLVEEIVSEFMLQKVSRGGGAPDPRAPRRRAPNDADHGGGGAVRAAARAAVRRGDRGAELEIRDGVYTGYLAEPPLVGEARAAWLRRYAELEGVDLRASYAYADSHSDLAAAAGGGQPGGGVAGRGAAAGGQAAPVADRGVGHGRGDAPGSVPEAGGALR